MHCASGMLLYYQAYNNTPMKSILLLGGILLLFTSMPAQTTDIELATYKQYVLEELIPACEANSDSPCIFEHLKKLTRKLEDAQSWKMYVDVLSVQIEYARQWDRQDIFYETLKTAQKVIPEKKNHLAEEYEDRWIENQLLWGSYYYERGDWARSYEKFKAMESKLLSQTPKTQTTYEHLASTCKFLGAILRRWAANDEAQQYYLRSIDYEKAAGEDETKSGYIAIAYKHLGDLHLAKGYDQQSERFYLKARDIYTQTDTTKRRNRNGLTATLLGLGALYKKSKNYNAGIDVLHQAAKSEGNSQGLAFDLWFHFGELYADQGNLALAHRYFNRAFDRRIEAFGTQHYKVAEVYTAYGELAARQNDYACALEHFQSALISLTEGFDETDIRQNPVRFQRTFIPKDIVSVLDRKIETLRRWAAVSGNDEHLLTAWATVQAAVHAVDILKTGTLQSEDDKLLFFRQSAQIFEHGIQIAWQLGPEFHAAAFELSEKSKAIVLLDAFRNANALRLAGIPDSLLEQEAQLKYEISTAEDARFRGDQSPELRDRLLFAQNEYRRLLRIFEEQYGNYYRLRYDNAVVSASGAQQLIRRGQSAVAFFSGTQSLFAFVLRSDGMTMYQLPSGEPIDALVTNMRAGIYDYFLASQRTAAVYESSAAQYVQSATQLYKVLLAPFAEMLPEDLLLIPDGVLGYLPFEALLTAAPSGAASRFKTHSYLLHRHDISYCYSMTLWQEMQQNPSANRKLAAFAPAFRPAASMQQMALRGTLDTLYFNRPEVETIASVLKQSGAYSGLQAVKSKFMQKAPAAGILHIASHGIANDTASGYSYIAFTSDDTDSDSSRLYARELYNLRLDAAMVVLSACETGIGELRKGEGIISLARAFAYAGAQSVVSTLWSVNDESTTHIMRAFYKDIRAGSTKSEALRNAKATYIQHSPEDLAAHPFYWSAYIAVGDMRPLYGGYRYAWWAAALILAGGGWWLFRTRP